MLKMTEKRVRFLAAARDGKALVGKAGFRSSRTWNASVDGLPTEFNAQFDALLDAELITVGAKVGGQWGPSKVELTAAGVELLKKFPV